MTDPEGMGKGKGGLTLPAFLPSAILYYHSHYQK